MSTIGQRVRRAREIAGMSQQALATAIGVTRSAISQLEADTVRNPRPAHLLALAEALKLDLNELVRGRQAAARAAEPAPEPYGMLPGERLLLDYIRATGGTDDERDRLARQALALLLAIVAQPVDDSRLGEKWAAPGHRGRR